MKFISIFLVVLALSAYTYAQECDDIDEATLCPDDIEPLNGDVNKPDYTYCVKMNPSFLLFYNSDATTFSGKWQAKMNKAAEGYSSLGMGPGATSSQTLYIVAQNAPGQYTEYGEHQQVVLKGTNRDSDAATRGCITGNVMTCPLDRGVGVDDKPAGRILYTHDQRMGFAWAMKGDGDDTSAKHSNYGSTSMAPCNPNVSNGLISGGGLGSLFEGGADTIIISASVAGAFLIVGVGVYYKKKQEQSQGAYFDHGGYASQWSGTNESSYGSSRSRGGSSKGGSRGRSRSKGSGSRGRGSSHGKRSRSKGSKGGRSGGHRHR